MFRWSRRSWVMAAILVAWPRPAASADGEVMFGSQWWTQSAIDAKYREFRDVPQGAVIPSFLLGDTLSRSILYLRGVNASQQDQSTQAGWIQGARMRLDLGYAQIPHNFSYTTRTPYVQTSPGMFLLPDTLQRTNQENPSAYPNTMTDLLGNSPQFHLGFRTDVANGRLAMRPTSGWQVEVTGSQRNRSGTKAWGAPFGFNSAIELVEPIQQRMTDGDITASYSRPRLRFQLGGGLSGFDNQVSTLFWDNPKRLTDRTSPTAYTNGDGSAAGQMDLYPDNHVARGRTALEVDLPRSTVLSATLGLAHYTQNDDWLPMTVNTAIPQSSLDSLPGRSTDGKANRLTGDYRLVSRPVPKLTATVRLHHDRYENDTPEHTFSGLVRVDQTFVPGAITSPSADYGQLVYGLDADYDFTRRVTIGGFAEQRRQDRTDREVERDDETVLGARFRARPGMGLELFVDYRHGDRTLDQFAVDEYKKNGDPDSALTEQPDLRRYDVADRVQNQVRTTLSLPVGETVTLSTGYTYLDNDYPSTALGLTHEKRQTVDLDLSWSPSDRLDVSGGGGWERYDTHQISRESGATLASTDSTNWTAALADHNLFAYFNASWSASRRLRLTGWYELTDARGTYDLDNFAHTAVDLPDTKYRRQEADVEARWVWMSHTDVTLRYVFEQYDVTDFGNEDIPFVFPVTGASTAIFLGDSSMDYRAHRVALLATRRF
jgi:MtrB/PioB family decaheme-associated outer membrane protein